MTLIKCPECEQRVSDYAPYCPNCGYPIVSQQEVHRNPIVVNQKQETLKQPHSRKTSYKKAIIIIVALVIITISVVMMFQYALFGTNRIAYDLIVKYAYSFKNPASVRVISGEAGDDNESVDEYAFVCLTATNAYGADVTGY
jgi:uncharacterized membrane protein YvbJ